MFIKESPYKKVLNMKNIKYIIAILSLYPAFQQAASSSTTRSIHQEDYLFRYYINDTTNAKETTAILTGPQDFSENCKKVIASQQGLKERDLSSSNQALRLSLSHFIDISGRQELEFKTSYNPKSPSKRDVITLKLPSEYKPLFAEYQEEKGLFTTHVIFYNDKKIDNKLVIGSGIGVLLLAGYLYKSLSS